MTTRRFLVALVAVGMLMTPGAYGADPDTDKAIEKFEDLAEGDTPIDPGTTLTISEIDATTGATVPLVLNAQGGALERAGGEPAIPTTLGVVEGSRVAIPRAADGSCPDVEVSLTDNIDVPMAIFDPADSDPTVRPRRLFAADVRSDIEHAIDAATCEVVITRARGYVKYRKKPVHAHLNGKKRRELPGLADIDPNVPLPTPTPDPGRAAVAERPPGAPEAHPAFRATTTGAIEPVPVAPEPRSSRAANVEWRQCILYTFEAYERRSLYRHSTTDPHEYGWYGYNRARIRYWDYPWRSVLKYSYLGYAQSSFANYYVSPQSWTTAWNNGQMYAPWLQYENGTLIVRQGGPSFSSFTHVWAGPWGQNAEWSESRVPTYPYGIHGYLWRWARGHNHTIYQADWLC
jgi:hypothetical protein